MPKRFPLRAWLVLAGTFPLAAQGVHAGLKLGVPLTPYFDTGTQVSLAGSAEYSAATRRYTLGATVEWRWTGAFGFEGDALYHRMGYVAIVNLFNSATGAYTNSAIDVKGNSWDFPLLTKYRFGRVVRPFVAGGGVLRYVGPVRGRGQQTTGSLVTGTSIPSVIDTTQPSELRKRFYPGLTAAGGIELGVGRIRVLPEVRYTHWTANVSGLGGMLRFAPNQAELLVGILF